MPKAKTDQITEARDLYIMVTPLEHRRPGDELSTVSDGMLLRGIQRFGKSALDGEIGCQSIVLELADELKRRALAR